MVKLRRLLLCLRDMVLFFLAYFLLTPTHKTRKSRNTVGLVDEWFRGNIKSLYQEMQKYSGLKVYFVTVNKKELERLRSSNVKANYHMDIRRIPLFLRTDVWVTASHFGHIPFARVYRIFRRFFDKHTRVFYRWMYHGKWVDVWHGGGGFKPTDREKMLADYDLGFVASEFIQQCYSKEPGISYKLKIAGNPRTDSLIKKTMSREKVLEDIDVPLDRKNVLYAPTWGRYHVNFLLENAEKMFGDIEEFCKRNNCNFLIRMHHGWCRRNPGKRKKLETKIKRSNHIFDLSVEKHPDVQPILYITDVLVTDWSSIVSDFILLDRPIIFLDLRLPTKYFPCLTLEDRIGYITKSKKDFFRKLHEAVHRPKLFEEKRRTVIKKMHRYMDGNSSKRCAQEIIKLLKDNTD